MKILNLVTLIFIFSNVSCFIFNNSSDIDEYYHNMVDSLQIQNWVDSLDNSDSELQLDSSYYNDLLNDFNSSIDTLKPDSIIINENNLDSIYKAILDSSYYNDLNDKFK